MPFWGGGVVWGQGGVVWGLWASFGGGGRRLCVCGHVVVAGCSCGRCSCIWMVGSSLSPLGVCSYSFACSRLCSCHRGRWVLGALVVRIDVAAGVVVVMGVVVVVVVVAVIVVVAVVVVVGIVVGVVVVVAVVVSRCVVVVVVEEVVTVVTCDV